MFSIQTAANQFLTNLSALEERISRSNSEVSSGLRVQTVSDDPASVTEILQLNSLIASNDQVKVNLNDVQTEMNAADDAISTAAGIMDQATQIATEGASSSSSVNRAQLAQQVNDLMTQMQQLANSQVDGRYVFSGNADQTAPYGPVNFATNTTNGVGAYQGSATNRTVNDSYGVPIQVSLTAQEIFDGGSSPSPTTSVFQALTSLYNALNSGSASATAAVAPDIAGAANYLSGEQAQYGDIQDKLANSLTTQSSFDTNLQSQLSNLQDADEATVVVQMQTDSTALTAAESAYSAFPKKSLFDYLA